MTGDEAPGRPFDGYAAIKWAISELQLLAARLGSTLGAEDDSSAFVWDHGTAEAADLYERTLADYGTLAAQYVRLAITDRRGIDPLA